MPKILTNDDRIYRNMPVSLVCSTCIRLRNPLDATCEAFPNGIPKPIWENKVRHLKPYRGDLGLTYKEATLKDLEAKI